MNRETAIVDTILNLRGIVAELIYHLSMDNERNAARLMDDIYSYSRSYRCLPIFTYEIERIDGLIKEECAPAGVIQAKEWQRRLLAIDIEDMEVVERYADWGR